MFNDTKRKRIIFLLIAFSLVAGVFALNLFYVPECDEYYFTQWRFSSFRPIEDSESVVGVMHNGRLLGNFLGVAQAKLVFAGFMPVRALLFTAGIVLLSFLISRLAFEDRRAGFLISLSLCLCVRNGFYKNVWSWGVSYVNYVLPFLCYLSVALMLFSPAKKEGGKRVLRAAAIFAAAFAGQLFSEPFTAAMCLFAVLLLFFKEVPLYRRICACAGFIAGGLCMFLNPEYRAVMSGESIHTVSASAEALFTNLGRMFYEGYFKNLVVPLLISLALAAGAWISGKKAAAVSVGAVSVAAAVTGFAAGSDDGPPTVLMIVFGVLLLAAWSCGIAFMKKGIKRRLAAFNLVFSAVSALPAILSDGIWSERMFFTCYIMLCLVLVFVLPEKPMAINLIAAAAAVLCVVWLVRMIPVYCENYAVNEQRVSYGLMQVEAGKDEITLPLLPNRQFSTNEHNGKGDLSFIIYREKPFDVKLKFVTYDKFSPEETGG